MFVSQADADKVKAVAQPKGDVTVTAHAKGYSGGPRSPGDVFQMPRRKDGSEPKGSWFTVVKTAAVAPKPVAADTDLA